MFLTTSSRSRCAWTVSVIHGTNSFVNASAATAIGADEISCELWPTFMSVNSKAEATSGSTSSTRPLGMTSSRRRTTEAVWFGPISKSVPRTNCSGFMEALLAW